MVGGERRHRLPRGAAAAAAQLQPPSPTKRGPRPAPPADAVAQLAALLAEQGGPPGGWDMLPPNVLENIFNRLELRDLAAVSSVCSTWRYEAGLDSRWKGYWASQVSDSGLWRWAKADGGYRQQLRAKQLVRRGDCAATVFPFSRRDGQVTEVLFFDGGAHDQDKRIVTVQVPKVPGQTVRLHGSTIKVWNAAALMAQKPLVVVHDCLKHLQLEDGRLFLWRIADDAAVLIAGDPCDEAAVEEAAHWAEHPSIVASVLDPRPAVPRLQDVPLEATFGRGVTPCEWLDMSNGLLAGSLLVPSQGLLIMRLFDVNTGRCLCASSCPLPDDNQGLQLQDQEVTMLVTRSGEGGSLVAATCALFDTRVFMWTLKAEWVNAQQAAAAAAATETAAAAAAGPGSSASGSSNQQQQQQAQQQHAARALAWDGDATLAAAPPAQPAAVPADPDADVAGQRAQQGLQAVHELRHVYSIVDQEPIVDISISTSAARLFVVGMENIYVADLLGVPFMRVSMSHWRGVVAPGQMMGPGDTGAFSWPLPNSTKAAFFLDSSNSLYISEFRRPQMNDYWYMQHDLSGGALGVARRPTYDHHIATPLQPEGVAQAYYVQSHIDLRQPPSANQMATSLGRPAGPRAQEPGVVEYSQDGGVLFTTGDTSCPSVAALLGAEKAAGTYLEGLGPAGAKFSGSGAAARRRPAVVRGGRGPRGGASALAPRALVLVDTCSGLRYKTVPIEGAIESVHSAGQYLVASIAELGSFPDGLNGAIVVLDFSGQGFAAAAPEPLPAAAASPAPAGRQQQRQAKQGRQRGIAGSGAAAGAQQSGKGSVEGDSNKGKGKQQKQQRRRQGLPAVERGGRGKPSAAAAAAAAVPAADEEPGPSHKRGRR